MSFVSFLIEQRFQCNQSFTDVTHQSEINLCSSTYLLTSDVDLNYVGTRRVKLLVWKISAKHKQQVRVHHSMISRGKAKQSSHAYIIGVIIFNELFPSHCVDNRSLEEACNLDQF